MCRRVPCYVPCTQHRKRDRVSRGLQQSFRSSATSYRRGAAGSETTGPAKATQSVSDKPGIRTPASGTLQWPNRIERKLPSWGSQQVLKPAGYLCWDGNKALQRQSWKCSSKEAQERKESSEKNQRELEKRGRTEFAQGPTRAPLGGGSTLSGYQSGVAPLLTAQC